MASSALKPGILLVHSRLYNPTPLNAATYLRWTKLHFRDMLNMTADPSTGGKVTADVRFAAPEGNTKYSHRVKDGRRPTYVYACILSDVGALKSEAYYSISRALNLENTRALGEEEEKVGYQEEEGGKTSGGGGKDGEMMVFDIVDARFAVYEDVGKEEGETFQNLPARILSPQGTKPTAPKSVLVGVDITLPPLSSGSAAAEDVAQKLRESLVQRIQSAVPPALKAYSSLYRWAGKKSQPDMHSFIDVEGKAEWMVLLCLVDEEGNTLAREHAEMLVQGWVDGEAAVMVGEGGKVGFGVWDGEVLMR